MNKKSLFVWHFLCFRHGCSYGASGDDIKILGLHKEKSI